MSIPAEQGPLNATSAAETQSLDIPRRRFLGKSLLFGAIVTILGGGSYVTERDVEQWLYPDNSYALYEESIPKAEPLKEGGTVFVVAGGMAQQSSRPEARQLAEDLGEEGFGNSERVLSMRYANHNFDIEEMGQALRDKWDEMKPDEIVLVGPSEATVVLMVMMQSIWNKHKEETELAKRHGLTTLPAPLPRVSYIAAYSSPSSIDDTKFAELGRQAADLHTNGVGYGSLKIKYSPSLISKAALEFMRPSTNRHKHKATIWDRITSVMSDTPDINSPDTMVSMLALLNAYNFEEQYQDFSDFLDPATIFEYYAATHDPVVDNKRAYRIYSHALGKLGLKDCHFTEVGNGHALTVPGSRDLSKSIRDRYAALVDSRKNKTPTTA